MRVKSAEYKFWKKKQNEKNLIKRTQRKTSNNSSRKKYKRKNRTQSQTPTKTFVVPRIFSITKNPEETIQFLNHIIK